MAGTEGPILFFDGECGLCARSVRWCLEHDHRGVLRFAPLQGETYESLPIPDKPRGMETMVLFEDGRLFERSEAWIRAMRALGGVWGAIGAAARIVPRPIRDGVYRLIAARRDRFGGVPTWRPLSEAERARILE